MAILTLAEYKTFLGVTDTDTARDASWTAIIAEVCDAINQACRPWLFEPTTVTAIVDAPLDDQLVLPVIPVRSITSLYLNWTASGDPAAFTSDNLLTQYTQYWLEIDDPVNSYSESGIVYKRAGSWNGQNWGGERRWPVQALGSTLEVGRGAIKVVLAAGTLTVPANVQLAACLMTSLIFNRREKGAPLNSESWNAYSYSTNSAITAMGAINSPDVVGLLRRYMTPQVARP
jgi:hypothetical protein